MNIKRIFFKLLICYLHYINQYHCQEDLQEELRVSVKNKTISRVRGNPTHLGEFSYSVIFYEDKFYYVNFEEYRAPICSGNVLSSRWVLTTATPLGEYSLKAIVMFAGVVHQSSQVTFPEAQYHINKIIIHPEWHEHEHNNLGLARTSKEIIFGIGLSTVRIPFNFKFASNNETLLCKLSIWSSFAVGHVMGKLQTTLLTKQSVEFKVSDEFQLCPNYYFPNETLCLLQYNASKVDICSVSVGSGISCGFGIIGIFTGGKNFIGCTDRSPLTYSALNLNGYIDWIKGIVNQQILTKNETIRTISCSDVVSFNFKLLSLGQLYLYFNVLNVY